ncbi:hypothetical protein OG417_27945 [Actinoallomurus sp. NBC_01490]|jgi:hypothetical protein|uniref:hypothetical protein n=1 Tax=Actinoallomurus sp. NBC_01490 TaxID=2903557 RepID=UPI002E2F20FD|nr:hypothetical protein [Actinoallomurus sp. NBC_01490]
MDVPELLARACALVPGDARSDAGLSAGDVREYLRLTEWDSALGILGDFPDSPWQTVEFWSLLERAAGRMWLDREVAWCRWRGWEARHGVIRAELRLVPPDAAGGRRLPIPGEGRLRPMWAIGAPSPDAGLHVARVWVESAPEIPPGGHGVIRLAPLTPADWRHLEPGAPITMHEGRPVAGTATIVQVTAPPGHDGAEGE